MITAASQSIPDGYAQSAEINLAANKGLLILLNVIGTILMAITFWLMLVLAHWVRPEFLQTGVTFQVHLAAFAWLVGLLGLMLLIILVHEAIHGLFFWVFTHSRPVFALRLTYAYAAAPDWYIPSRQYCIIGLAPLVIIDLVGLLLVAVGPPGWIFAVIFGVAIHTGGAVGDVFMVGKLLRTAKDTLVKDSGDSVRFYQRS